MSMRDWFRGFSITTPKPEPAAPILVVSVLDEINRYRTNQNKPQLLFDRELSKEAQKHCDDMAKSLRLNHDGFANRIAAVHPNTVAAENVEYNPYGNAGQIVQQWIDSPPHKKNMLGNFDYVGIAGSVGRDGNTYWTAIFDAYAGEF